MYLLLITPKKSKSNLAKLTSHMKNDKSITNNSTYKEKQNKMNLQIA